MKVLWKDTAAPRSYPPLEGDLETDVVIIGAGITGLSTACHLIRDGWKVAVLEAGEVGSGTTGSSTGNLYVPVGLRLYTIEQKHGNGALRQVAAARAHAIDLVEERVRRYGLDCEFLRVPFHLFSLADDEGAKQVEKEAAALDRAGLAVHREIPDDFPFSPAALLSLEGQAQFNPLQYIRGLAAALEGENCRIFEHTRVLEAEDGDPCRLRGDWGEVKAKFVVKATHTPIGRYAVHTEMLPCREYAVTARLEGKAPPPGIYWNARTGHQYSLRPYSGDDGDYLLVLGEPHKLGHQHQSDLRKLEEFLRRHFAVGSLQYSWSAQNYRPADNLPYIGVSPLQRHTFIATGYATDGLVYGTLAGLLIADAIAERENGWAVCFDPRRFKPLASARTFGEEGRTVAQHLWHDYVHYGQVQTLSEIGPGEGKTLELDGEKVAACRDGEGRLSIVSSVCPHMGCIVHWNGLEKSWDCPCHGSRFAVDGTVLEGPAQQGLARPRES